jgi:hypothetical protein
MRPEDSALDAIVTAFVAWVWRRLRADQQRGRRGRPRFLTIYGPKGELLKKIEVSEPDQPPSDRTEEERAARGSQTTSRIETEARRAALRVTAYGASSAIASSERPESSILTFAPS